MHRPITSLNSGNVKAEFSSPPLTKSDNYLEWLLYGSSILGLAWAVYTVLAPADRGATQRRRRLPVLPYGVRAVLEPGVASLHVVCTPCTVACYVMISTPNLRKS